MFGLRVSSLNYALQRSVVGVPGLIWMFKQRSDGQKKQSQTGILLLLVILWKTDIFAQNSSRSIMYDKWFGMHGTFLKQYQGGCTHNWNVKTWRQIPNGKVRYLGVSTDSKDW